MNNEFQKRQQRIINAMGAYRQLAEETGDYGPFVEFMTALGHRIDAEAEAAVEAIHEGRMMSEADVERHYRRLYPDEGDEALTDRLTD